MLDYVADMNLKVKTSMAPQKESTTYIEGLYLGSNRKVKVLADLACCYDVKGCWDLSRGNSRNLYSKVDKAMPKSPDLSAAWIRDYARMKLVIREHISSEVLDF